VDGKELQNEEKGAGRGADLSIYLSMHYLSIEIDR
jgi:hypothetical protein